MNEIVRKIGLWVNTAGYQSIPPDSPYPLRDHPSGYFFKAEKVRLFKEYTGYAPAKYFQELKLRKAKQLVVGTSQSVKETYFYLGF